jgi:hypothetical protein
MTEGMRVGVDNVLRRSVAFSFDETIADEEVKERITRRADE